MVGTGLVAHILVAKFDDNFPLYRQNEIFARMGARVIRGDPASDSENIQPPVPI